MDSDHRQLVVIARPSPDQPHRQLAAAFQGCYCYCANILQHCLNALRAFSDERHRFGILQELAFAAENQAVKTDLMLPAERYYQASEQKDADCRFPYITAILVSSMKCCVEQEHSSYRCSLEAPFHNVSNGSEPLYNDCKSTIVGVIDITDLRKPRYCVLTMVIWCVKCGLRNYDPEAKTMADLWGDELPEWEMLEYTPSSGEPLSYRLEIDSNIDIVPVREARDVEAMGMLQAYPLIDVATLANCWPSPAWKLPDRPPADSTQLVVHPRGLGAPKRGSQSLAELAQNKIIDAILLGILDDIELLDYPMLIRGFSKSFLATCVARADDLAASEHQGIIAAILARLLEGATQVDLYPFRKLPVGTIRDILCSDRLRDMKILNLSGLFAGSPAEIWTTLDAIPHHPEVIYLLNESSVDREDVREAVKNYITTGNGRFWDQEGSMRIIMGASISSALMAYASRYRTQNFQQRLTNLDNLNALTRGDTMRLQQWPWL